MNNSRFLQQLAWKLKQPQWVAVILSLGFHGALFAAGPSFSSLNMNALGGNVPEAERRQVPLIELTPEEQNRLPDFSGSAYSLFPEDNTPFELFPPSGSSLPLNPIPDGASNPAQPTPNPDSSVALGIAPYTPPRRPSISFLPRRSPLNRLPSGPSLPSNITLPPVENTPTPPAAVTPSTPTLVEPDPTSGPTASALYPEESAENNSVRLDGADGDSEGAVATPLQAQIEALAYRPENTTDEEAEANLEAWQASLEERLPGALEAASEPIEMQLSYVQRLCLDPEPTNALLGLVALPTDAGDDLELFPQVLKSTGYPFLDQEAAFALNDLKTPSESEGEDAPPVLEPAVMYQVQVNVEYDQETCIDRESLLEEIQQNQESTAAPGEENAIPAGASNSGQPEPSATPEASETPAPEPTPEETNATPSEPEVQPESTESPGAEALQ
jgi:hypothetical protein